MKPGRRDRRLAGNAQRRHQQIGAGDGDAPDAVEPGGHANQAVMGTNVDWDSGKVMSFSPFDRSARRRARDRAVAGIAAHDPLLRHVDRELSERRALLGDLAQGPELRIGLMLPPPAGAIGTDPSFEACRLHGGVQADEDRLPFGDGLFGHISGLMTLHGVNDLPGALLLMRRMLMPGGSLLLAFPGGFSLGALRDALLAADVAAGGGVAARLGPTVDAAEAAGLLQRAGFADPVVDVETLSVRVPSLQALVRDIRGMGDSGWLAARPRGMMTPRRLRAAEAEFAALADPDGKVPVSVQILYLSGKSPLTRP